tara:strand:+ start:439 stop:693 length:255 start_codon:yes stop_codon:yes gene_type:complete
MEDYIKKGILITCFKSDLGFRFYFKDLNRGYLYNPLTYESIDRGDGTFKSKTIIPYYKIFEDGMEEMKIQADKYLDSFIKVPIV